MTVYFRHAAEQISVHRFICIIFLAYVLFKKWQSPRGLSEINLNLTGRRDQKSKEIQFNQHTFQKKTF
jgi:hypothetical protein